VRQPTEHAARRAPWARPDAATEKKLTEIATDHINVETMWGAEPQRQFKPPPSRSRKIWLARG